MLPSAVWTGPTRGTTALYPQVSQDCAGEGTDWRDEGSLSGGWTKAGEVPGYHLAPADVPPDLRSLPTPTVIINRPLDTAAHTLLELDDGLLMRHLIYFQPDFAADGSFAVIPINEWKSLLKNIRFSLKWSNAVDMRDAARRYLRQLMLMISAEWTASGGNSRNLRWHFSRPEHMGVMPNSARSCKTPLATSGPVPIVKQSDRSSEKASPQHATS